MTKPGFLAPAFVFSGLSVRLYHYFPFDNNDMEITISRYHFIFFILEVTWLCKVL